MPDSHTDGESDAPSPASAEASAPGGGFALDVGDDLLAEALAAVEARSRPRAADPDEMDAFSADLEVDADEPLEAVDGDIDLAFEADGGDEDVVFDADEDTIDDLHAHLGDEDTLDEPELDLEAELSDLQAALDAALDRIDLLDAQSQTDRDARAVVDAEAEAERQALLGDKRKAMVLARRWKERAERAEARLEIAREARDEAIERALKSEAAAKHSDDMLEVGLARASERRRKELVEVRQAAPGKVLAALLPSIDNLRLAMEHADGDAARVIEGLEMISGQFEAALMRLGVERVAASPGTPFAPELHEAFAQEITDAVPAGSVLREVNAGYRLQGRLLRAARVIVAAAPAPDPTDTASVPDSPSPDSPSPDSPSPDSPMSDPDGGAPPHEARPAAGDLAGDTAGDPLGATEAEIAATFADEASLEGEPTGLESNAADLAPGQAEAPETGLAEAETLDRSAELAPAAPNDERLPPNGANDPTDDADADAPIDEPADEPSPA